MNSKIPNQFGRLAMEHRVEGGWSPRDVDDAMGWLEGTTASVESGATLLGGKPVMQLVKFLADGDSVAFRSLMAVLQADRAERSRRKLMANGQIPSTGQGILGKAAILQAIKDGEIKISGLTEDVIGPCSVDLHLAEEFIAYEPLPADHVVRFGGKATYPTGEKVYGEIVLLNGRFALGATREKVSLGPGIVGIVFGRSSTARLGLSIHQTAGYIDCGFGWCKDQGHMGAAITLEFLNAGPATIGLRGGDRVAQIAFMRVEGGTAENAYSGNYQFASGVEGCKWEVSDDKPCG